jgi:hypothetical protein
MSLEIEPGYLSKKNSEIYSDLKKGMLEDAIRRGYLRAFRIGKKTLIEKNHWMNTSAATKSFPQKNTSKNLNFKRCFHAQ